MDKDTIYHVLKESMEHDCCPICRRTDESVRATMRSILYEGMTDMDFRKEIMSQRGFCNHHSNVFLEEGDALAHAIVYSDALRGALKDVVADDFTLYETEKDCFFCTMAKETEEQYVRACYEALHEEEFLDAYKQGGMLCMLHLHSIRKLSLASKEAEDFYLTVAQATVDKYQVLIRELDEIQRKNDYRFTGEKWTEGEKTAWKRAVNVINDRVGLPKVAQKKKGWFKK
jgi:hypothetical protein